jgi:hypothetical protein
MFRSSQHGNTAGSGRAPQLRHGPSNTLFSTSSNAMVTLSDAMMRMVLKTKGAIQSARTASMPQPSSASMLNGLRCTVRGQRGAAHKRAGTAAGMHARTVQPNFAQVKLACRSSEL